MSHGKPSSGGGPKRPSLRSSVPLCEDAEAWLDEAERRDREMGDDPTAGIPIEDVLRELRSKLEPPE